MFDLLPQLLHLEDPLPDCKLCDASSDRIFQGMTMTQAMGDRDAHIVYVTDPANDMCGMTGEPVTGPEHDFISAIHTAACEDIRAVHKADLPFAIVPIIGCPASCLSAHGLTRSSVRCAQRARSFIEQLDPVVIVAMHKETVPLVQPAGLVVAISGIYAHSKLSPADSESRTVSDVLKIRQILCQKYEVPFLERQRPTTLRQF